VAPHEGSTLKPAKTLGQQHRDISNDYMRSIEGVLLGQGFLMEEPLRSMSFESGYRAILSQFLEEDLAVVHPSADLVRRATARLNVDADPALKYLETRYGVPQQIQPSGHDLLLWAGRVRKAIGEA
jgi:hypothetical protein